MQLPVPATRNGGLDTPGYPSTFSPLGALCQMPMLALMTNLVSFPGYCKEELKLGASYHQSSTEKVKYQQWPVSVEKPILSTGKKWIFFNPLNKESKKHWKRKTFGLLLLIASMEMT